MIREKQILRINEWSRDVKFIATKAKIETLEKAIFYCLCGFSLAACTSIAVGNVFLVLALLFTGARFIYQFENLSFLWRDHSMVMALTAFLSVMLISALASGNLLSGLNRFFGGFIYRMMPLFLVLLWVRERKQIVILGICLMASFFIADVTAITQGLQGNLRANGLFGHPMSFAGFSVILIPIYFLMLVNETIFSKYRLLILGLLIPAIAAVLFNGTRGAWLALLLAVPLTLIPCIHNWQRALMKFGLVMACFAVLFASAPQLSQRVYSIFDRSNQSNAERFLLWRSSWNMFLDNPIVGVGLGRYTYEYQNNYILPEAKEPKLGHAHNNFFQMLGESGILGCAAFSGMIGYFIYYALREWGKYKAWGALMILGATLGITLQGLTEYTFGNSAVMKLYWFTIALCIQMIKLEKRQYR